MTKKLFDAKLLAASASVLARRSFFDAAVGLSKEDGAGGTWYRIVKNAAANEADIFILSEIGFWGITGSDFVAELQTIDAPVINVHLSSPGGSVFDGQLVYNALAQHKSKIIVHIDALAASIASVIAMAGDEINISEHAQMMLHEPYSMVIGTAEDMVKEAEVLKSIEQTIIDIYAARTGIDREEITAMVKAETWLRGSAAVEAGFADKMVPNKKKAQAKASLGSDFYALIFPNAPADVLEELGAAPAKVAAQTFDFDTASRSDFERLLRASGCSGKRAKAITNNGFKPTTERPGGAKSGEEPTATDRPGDAVRRAATAAAILNAARAFPHL